MRRLIAPLFALALMIPVLPAQAEIRPGAHSSLPSLYYSFLAGEEREQDGWNWYNLVDWHEGRMPYKMDLVLVTKVGYTKAGRHTLVHQLLDPTRTSVIREVTSPYEFNLRDENDTFVARTTFTAEIQQPGKYWFRVIYDGKAIEDIPYLLLRN